MPSADAAPAPPAAATRKPRRMPVSSSSTAMTPTGIAIAYPATAPARKAATIGIRPRLRRTQTGERPRHPLASSAQLGRQGGHCHQCAREGNRHAPERAEQVVLRELSIVELLEPRDR